MDDEEKLETTNETENVETETTEEMQGEVNAETTETNNVEEKEAEKFTQEQLNDIIAERIKRERNSAKRSEQNIRREYDEKLADIQNILNAGFGTESLDDGLSRIKELCKSKGIKIPERSTSNYSNDDLEILANYTANEIVEDGYDAVDSELKKLANKGVDKMTQKEKLIFKKLDDTKKSMDMEKELASLGVKKEVLQSKDFKDFADKFTGSKFSMKDIYKMYSNNEPKPKAKPIGSMTNNNPKEEKSFISEAEYDRMTDKEIEANMDLIRKSMMKW